MGCGGGQMVSVLPFYFNIPSSNPAESIFYSVKLFEKGKKPKKRARMAHLRKAIK